MIGYYHRQLCQNNGVIMSISQKEAVFQAIVNVIGNDFSEGMNCKEWFTANPGTKEQVHAAVLEGANTVFEVKRAQKSMTKYVSGLINNHLTKDIRINGGTEYKPEKTGTRGGTDEIRATRKVVNLFEEGSPQHTEALTTLNELTEAYQAEKQAKEIDLDALPEHLRKLLA